MAKALNVLLNTHADMRHPHTHSNSVYKKCIKVLGYPGSSVSDNEKKSQGLMCSLAPYPTIKKGNRKGVKCS